MRNLPGPYPVEDKLELFGDAAIAKDGYVKDTCIYLNKKSVHDNGMRVEYDNGARAVHANVSSVPKRPQVHAWGDMRARRKSALRIGNRGVPRWINDSVTYKIGAAEGGHAEPTRICWIRLWDAPRTGRSTSTPNTVWVDGLRRSGGTFVARTRRGNRRAVQEIIAKSKRENPVPKTFRTRFLFVLKRASVTRYR